MNYRSTGFQEHIAEQAAEWFIEFRSGDIDQAGRRVFQEWVRSSPEHLRAYLEYAAIWNEGDAIDPQREIDVAALIANAKAGGNIVHLEHSGREPAAMTLSRGVAYPYRRMAIAAAALIALGGLASLTYLKVSHSRTYSTEAGEQRSIQLSDGSTVELNSRSTVRVRLSDRQHRIVDLLEGQALFKVAKDSSRPFIVRSDDTRVRAVGTQFDVNRKRTDTIVTVLEGKVAISSEVEPWPAVSLVEKPASVEHLPVYLSAGEQVAVREKVVRKPVRANTAATTAWTQRQLVLESASLREVAEEFNRYSVRTMIAEDTAREELRLSGVFSTDPDFLLRYLGARPDITVIEKGNEIQILHHD